VEVSRNELPSPFASQHIIVGSLSSKGSHLNAVKGVIPLSGSPFSNFTLFLSLPVGRIRVYWKRLGEGVGLETNHETARKLGLP
jgi:hypothetical protein